MTSSIRLAAATAVLVMSTGLAGAADLKFATGPQGGSWYPLGGAMKALIEKELPGTNVALAPGGGVVGSTIVVCAALRMARIRS